MKVFLIFYNAKNRTTQTGNNQMNSFTDIIASSSSCRYFLTFGTFTYNQKKVGIPHFIGIVVTRSCTLKQMKVIFGVLGQQQMLVLYNLLW